MVLAILAETTEPTFSFLMLRLVSSVMARGYPLADFLAAGFLAAFLAAFLWTADVLGLACALALGLAAFWAPGSDLAALFKATFAGLCDALAFLGAAGAAAEAAVLCGSSICSSR